MCRSFLGYFWLTCYPLTHLSLAIEVWRKTHHSWLDVSLPWHSLLSRANLYSSNGREFYRIISAIPLSLYTYMLTQAKHLLPTVQPWPYHHSSSCCFQYYCGCHHHANPARRSKSCWLFFSFTSALYQGYFCMIYGILTLKVVFIFFIFRAWNRTGHAFCFCLI